MRLDISFETFPVFRVGLFAEVHGVRLAPCCRRERAFGIVLGISCERLLRVLRQGSVIHHAVHLLLGLLRLFSVRIVGYIALVCRQCVQALGLVISQFLHPLLCLCRLRRLWVRSQEMLIPLHAVLPFGCGVVEVAYPLPHRKVKLPRHRLGILFAEVVVSLFRVRPLRVAKPQRRHLPELLLHLLLRQSVAAQKTALQVVQPFQQIPCPQQRRIRPFVVPARILRLSAHHPHHPAAHHVRRVLAVCFHHLLFRRRVVPLFQLFPSRLVGCLRRHHA